MKSNLLKHDKLDQQLYYSLKGDFDKSDSIINHLLTERPYDNRVIFNSAFMYLRKGDIKEGMKRLNDGGRQSGIFKPFNFPYPILNNLSNLQNKNILVDLEGGYGDIFVGLKFVREINKLGANMIVLAPKPLHSFLKHQSYIHKCYQNISEVKENIDYCYQSLTSENIMGYTDYNQIPREPHLFYKSNDNIISDKIKVGVKFQCGNFFDYDYYRSPKVEDIIQILEKYKDVVQFYSLEKDYIHLPDFIVKSNILDFCDTSNIIQQMDFVISTCTSVAHLSAGLGKKTIIMVSMLPYWGFIYEREDKGSWYYKDVVLLRQKEFGKWGNVLEELKEEIEKEIF